MVTDASDQLYENLLLCDNNSGNTIVCPPGLQGASWFNCSISVSSFLTQAVVGYDRPTSTRVVFHGPAHGSATGALQSLDHGYGTVCRAGFASPTMTLENFVSS